MRASRRHPRASAAFLCATILLTVGATVLVACDTRHANRVNESAWDFQRLVGGLGLGPALTLDDCEAVFDVRLAPDWRGAHPPLVGGEYFCPWHGASVFPLRSLGMNSSPEAFDASVP